MTDSKVVRFPTPEERFEAVLRHMFKHLSDDDWGRLLIRAGQKLRLPSGDDRAQEK